MKSELPNELNARGSILFLGSGFSRNAKNIRNSNLPTGAELKARFEELLDLDTQEHDLKILADEIHNHIDYDLYDIIYELYTVEELNDEQVSILTLPWLRIYTTNYDDVVEQFNLSLSHKERRCSYSYNDVKPKRVKIGSVIHLHGCIRETTRENILDQLILNENSYIMKHFERSVWYDEFQRDLRFSRNCFFVGYSLSDYDIAALLMQNPRCKDKTYFVCQKNPDKILSRRFAQYGIILPIETEGFADLCHNLPTPNLVADPHRLRAFIYLDPFSKRALQPPTSNEIMNLVTYGVFNYQRCLATLPQARYVTPRQTLINEALTCLDDKKCLLVHSRIGNGKTIFLYVLAHALSQKGYRCFWLRSDPMLLQEDLETLQSFPRVAIFIDSYNVAVEVITQLEERMNEVEIKFIVSVRTSMHDVRLHEIKSKFPPSLARLNLNPLSREEKKDFLDILDKSGMRAENLDDMVNKAVEIRDITLGVFKNREVREKINKEFDPLLENDDFRLVFSVMHLLQWIGQDVDMAFVRSVTKKDAYLVISQFRETAGDIFSLDDERISIRSAIFSEYMVQYHLSSKDVLQCTYAILIEAVKRKFSARFRSILSGLMKFSTLKKAMLNDPDRIEKIDKMYERLSRDMDMNKEPLFWLQYSILRTESDALTSAESFITTAYDRAKKSPGFQTFQIDTYSLKLSLIIERREKNHGTVKRFEKIVEQVDRVRSMIGNEMRRYHAIRVLEEIEPFVEARIEDFSTEEKTVLVYHLHLLIKSLAELSDEEKAITGSNIISDGIGRSIDRIIRSSSVIIKPVKGRLKYDIAIPIAKPTLTHDFHNLSDLDVHSLEAIFDQEELAESLRIRLKLEFATTETGVHEADIAVAEPEFTREILTNIARKVMEQVKLTNCFAKLYPVVRDYVVNRCFGQRVDLEDETIRSHLAQLEVREGIAKYLAREITSLTIKRREMVFDKADFRLSETKPFSWRRDLPPLESRKTVFNFVATYNDFERSFAKFLDNAGDVVRFAALGTTEQGTSGRLFRIDYLQTSGTTGFYYPDWVAVQKTDGSEVNWIIETKGRVWEDIEEKDAAMQEWCRRASAAIGIPWRYIRVNQAEFRPDLATLRELVVKLVGQAMFTERDQRKTTMSRGEVREARDEGRA